MDKEAREQIDRITAGSIYTDIRNIHEGDYYQYVLELAKVFERYGYHRIDLSKLTVLTDEQIFNAYRDYAKQLYYDITGLKSVVLAQLEHTKKQIEEMR